MECRAADRVRPTTSMWAMTLSERENAANLLQHTTIVPFTYLSYPFSFKCFYCTERYSELSKLLEHAKTHTVPDTAVLMKEFLKKGKKTIKVDMSELKCKICNDPFSNLDDVRKHLSCVHDKKFTEAGNGIIAFSLQTKNGTFSCHLCSENFHSFFLLNKHINVHYSNAICESCGKGFVSHTRLLQHKETHLTGQYPCDKCKKMFTSLPKYKYHNDRVHRNATKVKPSKCHLCEARFEHYYEKIKHLKDSHGMTYNYPCEICSIVFETRKSLYFHTKKYHTQNILCEVCNKPFAERNHLKKHMAMHTKARNFACSLCSKTYRYEKNLKDHMRVHNPDWRFACSNCWVGFQSKIEYRKHMAELHAD